MEVDILESFKILDELRNLVQREFFVSAMRAISDSETTYHTEHFYIALGAVLISLCSFGLGIFIFRKNKNIKKNF